MRMVGAPAADRQRRALPTIEQEGRAAKLATAPTAHATRTAAGWRRDACAKRGLTLEVGGSPGSAMPFQPCLLRWAARMHHVADHAPDGGHPCTDDLLAHAPSASSPRQTRQAHAGASATIDTLMALHGVVCGGQSRNAECEATTTSWHTAARTQGPRSSRDLVVGHGEAEAFCHPPQGELSTMFCVNYAHAALRKVSCALA